MNEEIKQILIEKLKDMGIDVIDAVFEILEVLIEDSESTTDDLLLKPMLPMIKQLVLSYVEQLTE